METELVTWKNGTFPQLENQEQGDEDDGSGEQKGDHARDFIAFAEARKK